jgi:hypothetical protein
MGLAFQIMILILDESEHALSQAVQLLDEHHSQEI